MEWEHLERTEGEAATMALGARLLHCCQPGTVIYLSGNLGAGKTTLVRGMVRGAGHDGPVRSPTYALVESYRLAVARLHHFDLYRLADPDELEFIGIRDYFDHHALAVVEWPEKGAGVLPQADLVIHIDPDGAERRLLFRGHGPKGHQLIACLEVSDSKA